MTTVEKNILNAYSKLFEGLDHGLKRELLRQLTKSLDKSEASRENAFYRSYGTFPDDKTAEQIIEDIKASRAFTLRHD